MKRLFVVRHGQTDWNVAFRIQGTSDTPLNDVGRGQALRMADALAPLLAEGSVIVSSPLVRARDTAQALASALGIDLELDPRLVERAYGIWEGLTREERELSHPREHADWALGIEPMIDGYEAHAAVAARMIDAATAWFERAEGDLVFVTHGSSGRMLILDLLGLPHDSPAIGHLGNGEWSELRPHRSGAWTLARHNAVLPG